VISHLTEEFERLFTRLPERVQKKARKNYRLWQSNPAHPSLDFKRVHSRRPIYSVRIGTGWRALGILEDDSIVWFWIGPHNAYDKILSRLS
jgi:hypothetical protein